MGSFGKVFALSSVSGHDKELVASIKCADGTLFGIVTDWVLLLGCQNSWENGLFSNWIARRAKIKRTYPGPIDSTVEGGLPTGRKALKCLVRESAEKAFYCNGTFIARKRKPAEPSTMYVGPVSEEKESSGSLVVRCNLPTR